MEKLKISAFCKKYGVSAPYMYDILPKLRESGLKYINKIDRTVQLVEHQMSDNSYVRYLIITRGNNE